MIYDTILVNLNIDDPVDLQLRSAWQLAEFFKADLIGFCACAIILPAPVDGDGGFEAQFFAQQKADIQRHLDDRRARFQEITGDSGRASWRGLTGDTTTLLAKHARAADLIVTCTGRRDVLTNGYRSVDVASLILSAGRPVLLVSSNKTSFKADRILVGWKDTREARRAVVDAMPLLKRASNVLVSSVEEDNRQEMAKSVAVACRRRTA